MFLTLKKAKFIVCVNTQMCETILTIKMNEQESVLLANFFSHQLNK